MIQSRWSLFLLLILMCSCNSLKQWNKNTKGTLRMVRLSKHAYMHVSYLPFRGMQVACNGLVYIKEGEAIIFDTPVDEATSKILINWVREFAKAEIKAIVPGHFHDDCVGGLDFFHEEGIPSFASEKTIALAKENGAAVPQNSFKTQHELEIGGQKVICQFMGQGHTQDNIIGYIPSEKIMFGGCLIKSEGAGKGNLNDANVDEWSSTALRIKAAFPNVKIIVPGHGKSGGIELLDYTAKLFQKEE